MENIINSERVYNGSVWKPSSGSTDSVNECLNKKKNDGAGCWTSKENGAFEGE